MKQKILMLLAAVLLSSVNAFAQSGDSESLKGDVNGDGIVDVADIAAIIDIMANGGGAGGETKYYWYAGNEIPTSISGTADYNNGGGWTSTGNSVPDQIYQLVKGFDSSRELYAIVPVTDGTTLKPVASDMSTIDTSVQEHSSISYDNVNYKVYTYGDGSTRKTIMFAKVGGNISAPTYYWYVGQTDPSTMSEISPITDYNNGGGWYELGTEVPPTIRQLIKGGDSTKTWYAAVPITSGTTLKPVASDMTTLDTSVSALSTKQFNGVNYQIYDYGVPAGRGTFNFAKLPVEETAYYWYVGTTAVNPSNYKTVASQVTTIPESTTISLNEQQLFIVAPSNKTVTALTSDGDGINLNTYDTSTGTFTRTATTLGDGYTLYASRGTSITDSAAVINVR